MRRGTLSIPVTVLALLGATACDDSGAPGQPDGSRPPDARTSDASWPDAARPPDGGGPDAGAGCALPATEEWFGTASYYVVGGGGDDTSLAEVRWTRAATDGCVDRYVPSGTATYLRRGRGCGEWIIEPASAPIDPGDGELVIDRTTSPAHYQMHGESSWMGTVRCSDDPPGEPRPISPRPWAPDLGGWFDGAAFGGTYHPDTVTIAWEMFAADAVFTPPGEECSEPSSERWASVSHSGGSVAIATWTRVSTIDCVDRYSATGVGEMRMEDSATCSPLTYDPIAMTDGTLVIDRSTDPARYQIGAGTGGEFIVRCTLPDGTVEARLDRLFRGRAAWGLFDGDRFGAEVWGARWRVERLPAERGRGGEVWP